MDDTLKILEFRYVIFLMSGLGGSEETWFIKVSGRVLTCTTCQPTSRHRPAFTQQWGVPGDGRHTHAFLDPSDPLRVPLTTPLHSHHQRGGNSLHSPFLFLLGRQCLTCLLGIGSFLCVQNHKGSVGLSSGAETTTNHLPSSRVCSRALISAFYQIRTGRDGSLWTRKGLSPDTGSASVLVMDSPTPELRNECLLFK